MKSVAPNYRQFVTCPTRGSATLDHCYCPVKGAYKSIPRASLGNSDHSVVFLIPAYKQELKQSKPTKKTVRICLLRQLNSYAVVLNVPHGTGLDEYAETTIDYINICVDSCVQTKVLTQYPNNKPWFNKKIRRKLLAKDEAYRLKDVNPEEFRLAKSSLKTGIRDAKQSFKVKLEDRFDTYNPRELWGNINLITQYKGPVKTASTDDATLPSQLNNFYSRFDNANATAPATVP